MSVANREIGKPSSPTARYRSLDALRGFAILGMAFAGLIPNSLPPWMFHAQMPPPDHVFSPNIFGITWVDLVFPFFLFSMGAAIPLSLTKRLESGASAWRSISWLAARGLLLAVFALLVEHLRPFDLKSQPDRATWLLAFSGFVLITLVFLRWPPKTPKWVRALVPSLAWVCAALIIVTHPYPDGLRGFENYRIDIILIVLANVAFSGGFIWLLTRCRPLIRFGVMAAVALICISFDAPGSLSKAIWDFAPSQFFDLGHWQYGRFVPILYHFEYHKYLLVVLPGTFCGDLVLRAPKSDSETGRAWSWWRAWLLFLIGIAMPILACWGLYARVILPTSSSLILLCAIAIGLAKPNNGQERLISGMVRFGSAFLILGLLAEPIGGGIRKDSPTLSYYFVTAGLAFFFLCSLQILYEILRGGKILKPVQMAGENPMLAYIAITNLAMPLGAITGYSDWLGAILPKARGR